MPWTAAEISSGFESCAQAYIYVGLLQLWHFSTAAKMEARDLERDAISLRQVQLEFP